MTEPYRAPLFHNEPMGCICPPTSEQACQSLLCPRKAPATSKPTMHVCDCCQREVDHVRGSIWRGEARICRECFFQWYDPDNNEVDPTKPVSIGNYVRKKHGLPPLAKATT